MKNLYLATRFYYVMATLIGAMMLAYPFPLLLPIIQTALVLFGLVVAIDFLLLFNRNVDVRIERNTPQVLSLGDENDIAITLHNRSNMLLQTELIDELPEQFQVRDFTRSFRLAPMKQHIERYTLRPLTRGEYC